MFNGGLTATLIRSLADVARHIPSLVGYIQERLINELAVILSHKPFTPPGAPPSFSDPSLTNPKERNRGSVVSPPSFAPELIQLALETLGTFDLSDLNLLPFLRKEVIQYADHSNDAVRKAAVLTLASLILKTPTAMMHRRSQTAMITAEVVDKLLNVGIADPNPDIRVCVLEALDHRFDEHLAQAESVSCLLMCLHDEIFSIREATIRVIGRLTIRNPACVMPGLRKTLIQLLSELEYSTDSQFKEEAVRLLGMLIHASSALMRPYIAAVLNAVLPKLKDTTHQGVATAVLEVIGELCIVGGEAITPYMDALLPPIIDTLKLQSAWMRREVAVTTLRHLMQNTGQVDVPYRQHPCLLGICLDLIATPGSPWKLRQEVLKAIGVLGAIDPFQHKMNTKQTPVIVDVSANIKTPVHTDNLDLLGEDEVDEPSVKGDPCAMMTVKALMNMFRDPSLANHHKGVIQSIMYMVRSLGQRSVLFLPQIIPVFMEVIRVCDPSLRESLLQNISSLIGIVQLHARPYLGEVMKLVKEYWNEHLEQLLGLVRETSKALKDEFKIHLPELLPLLLGVLQSDNKRRRVGHIDKVLRALEGLAPVLVEYLYLIAPAFLNLAECSELKMYMRIRALEALATMCRSLHFSDYASRIIHPLIRILRSDFNQLHIPALNVLSVLAQRMRSNFLMFVPMLKAITRDIDHPHFQMVLEKISNGEPIYVDPIPEPTVATLDDGAVITKKMDINQDNLKKAWDTNNKCSPEDWTDWIKRFSVELLRESPSPALRSCSSLAQEYPPLSNELFNVAFSACYDVLLEVYQSHLIRCLEYAFNSATCPPDVTQKLLDLAEYLDHNDNALPIDIARLASLAESVHASAKALHYQEQQLPVSPASSIEALIRINNKLEQPEAAVGILTFAQQYHSDAIEVDCSWYEKLGRWNDALKLYNERLIASPKDIESSLGLARCYDALADWERVFTLATNSWSDNLLDEHSKQLAPLAANAAWMLGEWNSMGAFVECTDIHSIEGGFLRAVLAIHENRLTEGLEFVDQARRTLDSRLSVLMRESYSRAYNGVVWAQNLTELEEIIELKNLGMNRDPNVRSEYPHRFKRVIGMWKERLNHSHRSVSVWQRLLGVRTLLLPPQRNVSTWIKFASLCRQDGKLNLALRTLRALGISHPGSECCGDTLFGLGASSRRGTNHFKVDPKVSFAYIKHLRASGELRLASEKAEELVKSIEGDESNTELLVRVLLRLGEWRLDQEGWNDSRITQSLRAFERGTELMPNNFKTWHAWAMLNYDVVSHHWALPDINNKLKSLTSVPNALIGFFKSIALCQRHQYSKVLQNILRLLTLWFNNGCHKGLERALGRTKYNMIKNHDIVVESIKKSSEALKTGFSIVEIDVWLQVVPQLIARIEVGDMAKDLLSRIGKKHPQALIYSLAVGAKSRNSNRQRVASEVLQLMEEDYPTLVQQAMMTSKELIRVAVLWSEIWRTGLEDASRYYMGQGQDYNAMFKILKGLYHLTTEETQTVSEEAFVCTHGRDIHLAYGLIKSFMSTKNESQLRQAWEKFYGVFQQLSANLKQVTMLHLSQVSPRLLKAHDMELAVPGTYQVNEPVVRISGFVRNIPVIQSKQSPRRIAIFGSDGKRYRFLLKGNEDLRQDERVMQLFSLVNSLLAIDGETCQKDLGIQRYAVIPLSHNAGIVGWIPNSDTLHALIREYREQHQVVMNIEMRLIMQQSPDFDKLTLMQKVEVFEHALRNTHGDDLQNVLWLKAPNAQVWLERRTNFTRSLATMSMVGHILGLGDRHLSNMMLDRETGKVQHIDFGDCFEVAMLREKYPEKVPFRLTRMLVRAMEVSGIEGNFRSTCEAVMRVLRDNRESVRAILEAFVDDPLINWRLLMPHAISDHGDDNQDIGLANDVPDAPVPNAVPNVGKRRRNSVGVASRADAQRIIREAASNGKTKTTGGMIPMMAQSLAQGGRMRSLVALKEDADEEEAKDEDVALKKKANEAADRIWAKLTGRDFDNQEPLEVPEQVDRLVKQATNHINLCQAYLGWCPFW
eukprot:TRINITY_DN422070_c0_g1_i1.p1 TRINITY_DN422070_c0_g1~~TRINITY_DN422070_c0_g1_i1.p1  ORF type:complete len:2040 (-),score=648.42 TRINITY_DN422070_c0_g1_i1:182-6301(-)